MSGSLPFTLNAKRAVRKGAIVLFLTFGVVGGWLYVARLDSAVIAPGTLATKLSTRAIQHPEGGVVSELAVVEGEKVEEGQLLLRLDNTQKQASSTLFETQLKSSLARRARLEAEVRIEAEIDFPADLLAAQSSPEVARTLSDEQTQFNLTRAALLKNTDLLRTQIAQAEEEVRALEVQQRISRREYDLVSEDLGNLEELREKGLANQARVTELRRDQLLLEGKIAQSEISIVQIKQSITGFELEIERARDQYRERASEQLEAENRTIRSLQRDAIIAAQSLSRVEIFSPVTGTVQENEADTAGSVVGAGQVLMKIAPESNDYILEARVGVNDIKSLSIGLPAEIRFNAFQALNLPPFDGELESFSRDRITDPATNLDYFEARVRIAEDTIPEDISTRLVAGMTAIVYLPIEERTALEYLLDPFARRLEGALREE